jgi:DNA-binding ferritin-like protein
MKPKILTAQRIKANSDGSVRFRLTGKQVDRYGEVVLPDGIDLEEYGANPIVMYGHGYGSSQGNVPIGKLKMNTVKITKSYVDADIKFDEESGDKFAAMIAEKVRLGYLNAGSIGFNPTEVSHEPVMPKQTGVTFTKWKLLEFSIVAVPALASALAQRDFQDLRDAYEEQYGEAADYDEMVNRFFNGPAQLPPAQVNKDFSEDEDDEEEPEVVTLETQISELTSQVKELSQIVEKGLSLPRQQEDPPEENEEIENQESLEPGDSVEMLKASLGTLLIRLKYVNSNLNGGHHEA